MTRLVRLVALLLLTLAPTSSMRAQQQPARSLSVGSRVRVTAPGAGLLNEVGRVESLAGDSLMLVRDRDGTAVWVGAAAVQALEVSRGRRRRIGTGVALGYALMFALGFAGHPGMQHTDVGRVAEGIRYGVVYGTPVALLGGVVGSTIRSERWVRVQWSGRDAP